MADRQVHIDTAKLYTDMAELRTAMIGIDGKNGLRGEFKNYSEQTEQRIRDINHTVLNLSQKFDYFFEESRETSRTLANDITKSNAVLQNYFDHGRKSSCHGIIALDEHQKMLKQWEKDEEGLLLEYKKLTNERRKNYWAFGTAVVLAGMAIGERLLSHFF